MRLIPFDIAHRPLEPQRPRLVLRRALVPADRAQPQLDQFGLGRVLQIKELLNFGDRRLVAAERRRQRDPVCAPAPGVEHLEVGFEHADRVRRARSLIGGDKRLVDNDVPASAHLGRDPRNLGHRLG